MGALFLPKTDPTSWPRGCGLPRESLDVAARRLTRSLTRLLLMFRLMFRHSLLPCACFGVALGIAAALPIPAHSQDRSTYDRLDRLERDLNMLQRQVYRGGPAPAPGGGDPGVAMNAELRMDRIETQMRELTGRVEEFMNQLDRLRQRLEQGNGDPETRVSQMPPGSGGYAAGGPPPPLPRPRGSTGPGRELPDPGALAGGPLMPPGRPMRDRSPRRWR